MDRKITIQELIATAVVALRNCEASDRNMADAADSWSDLLDTIEREFLPSGSGFDSGTTIDRERTDDRTIVLDTSFHHMNGDGMYDGWTEHTVYIRATFNGPDISSISGRDRNDIKDYIGESVLYGLSVAVNWTADGIERLASHDH